MISKIFHNDHRNTLAGCAAVAVFLLCLLSIGPQCLCAADSPENKRTIASKKCDGYRGIWFTLGQYSKYGDKYSGGLGTYTSSHVPLAIYAPAVEKTFFVYGGSRDGERYLLSMASYYDHKTGKLPRPTIVHDKAGVDDPHDNPSIALDDHGHVWVYVSGRGRRRPGFIYRSVEPYSTDDFEQLYEGEFTYPQPWWVENKGFLFLFTQYTAGRELYFATGRDGMHWSPPTKLAGMEGHYQVSNCQQGRVFTTFNQHPDGRPDRRTNLYYLESRDMGQTWQTVEGKTVTLPLTQPLGPALVRNYQAEGRLIYINDVQLDENGHPLILLVTSAHFQPGPIGEPRYFTVVHWDGKSWQFRDVTRTTHNYNVGSLSVDADSAWRLIAPTEPGPQHWGTGGEIALWTSGDQGVSWRKERVLTSDSSMNHMYVRRPVNARDDFFCFWADGNPDRHTPSRLYFTDRSGTRVWRLPEHMPHDTGRPEAYGR